MFIARQVVGFLFVCSLLAVRAGPAAGQPAKPDDAGGAPVAKIDRSSVIGAPVLDQAPRGIHLWVEDGWYQLAAVTALPVGSKVARKMSFTVTVRSSKPIAPVDLERWEKKTGGAELLTLHVVAGADPERMRFKTEGEVIVSEARGEAEGSRVPLFVGPLARPAASSVRVGRY